MMIPLLAQAVIAASEPAGDSPSIDAASVDALAGEALKAWGAPGAAVAIVQGDEAYIKGYGIKELGGTDCVTSDTLFAMGSTTKAFTTTAMAMLVDEGKMSWDDPVRKHLPRFKLGDPLADANVTLRDLVSHRTGLARHDALWYGSEWDSKQLLRRVGLLPLDYPFRSIYQYNNLMYMAAGQAIEAVWGGAWEDFVKVRILDPLGMTGTLLSSHALKSAKDYANPHSRELDGVVPVPWKNIDNVAPAGSMIAGIRELSHWVKFQLGDGTWEGKRLVSKENLDETHTPQMVMRVSGRASELAGTTLSSYCLGWIRNDYRSYTTISHSGAIDGFHAGITLVPKLNLGVAVLANMDGAPAAGALSRSLLDLMLGLPPIDWNAELMAEWREGKEKGESDKRERENKRIQGTKPSRELEAYVGGYEDAAYGPAEVSLRDGGLFFCWNSHSAKLHHFHYDTFAGKLEQPDSSLSIQVSFSLGPDGEVAELRLLWPEASLDREFKKVKQQS